MRKKRFGILEGWNVGILEYWNIGRLERWAGGAAGDSVNPLFHSLAIQLPIIFALVLGLLTTGCGKGTPTVAASAKKPVPGVQVMKAQRRDLSQVVTYTGSVEPVKIARMASPAEGPIAECPVREGDMVKTGQLLVKVGRSRIADTALAAAREEMRRQEAEFKRVEQLVKSGSLPGEQMDAARSSLRHAEAHVAAMETGRSDYEISAPWTGMVSKVWVSEGNYVSPRAPLVELYDPASMVVRFSIPERDMPFLNVGASAQVQLHAYPGRTIQAEIVRVYPELDAATRTVTVEAELREEANLLSGLFARVAMPLRTVKDAVVIQDRALVVLPNGSAVVFVVADGKASLRKVKVLLDAGGLLAVENGVEMDEMVITRGNESLKDGMAVQAMDQANKAGGGQDSPSGKRGAPKPEPQGKAENSP